MEYVCSHLEEESTQPAGVHRGQSDYQVGQQATVMQRNALR